MEHTFVICDSFCSFPPLLIEPKPRHITPMFFIFSRLKWKKYRYTSSLLFSEKTATTSNKICPGGESECMDTETCCKLAGGGYGCCPLKHAVCCKDGEHCCPQGYICSEGEIGFPMVEIHQLPKISDCNISDIKVEKLKA